MRRLPYVFFALFVLAYILPIGYRPLTSPDETRYGEIPREMLASEDWVVPRLNGLKYFEKPVFGYWVNALSITLFGENAFALRLPSALSVILTTLMIFVLVRTFSQGGGASVLAPAIFLTCPLVLVLGHINILDNLFSLFLTGALIAFFFGYMAQTMTRRSMFMVSAGIFCGLGFLTKGFLAGAMPVLTVVPFLIWEGRFKSLLKLLWIPLVTACLIVLPWALMIHLREGDFWDYFFWTEHVARFIDPVRGQHPKPLWYFVPILIGGALPWAIQTPAAFSILRKQKWEDPLVRFALCWFLFPFLFFSVCSGKLIPYILPCFPPIAILFAIGLREYFEAGKRRAFSVSAWILAAVAGFAGVALLSSQMLLNEEIRLYESGEEIKWTVAALGAFAWAFLVVLSIKTRDHRKSLAFYCAGMVTFFFIVNFVVPSREIDIRAPGELLERNRISVTPEAVVVSDDTVIRAVCWFFKRNDVLVLERAGELTYGLEKETARPGRFLTIDAFKRVLEENSGKNPVVLVLKRNHYQEYEPELPPPLHTDMDRRFMVAVF
jgi:4-amino-4-deoxy-L-arabinose transferase